MDVTATETDHVQYACAHCGQVNRIPRRRVGDDPTCGRCKQKVFPRRPVAVTELTWRTEVEESPIPVLVEFWAPWCGPCRAVAPVLDAIAAERGGKLKVAKVNSDENPRLAARFGVKSIPFMVVLRGPLEVDRVVGALSKEALDLRLARVV